MSSVIRFIPRGFIKFFCTLNQFCQQKNSHKFGCSMNDFISSTSFYFNQRKENPFPFFPRTKSKNPSRNKKNFLDNFS